MTVLDTFYLLFKSDTTGAEAANKKLEESTRKVAEATKEVERARDDLSKKTGKQISTEALALKNAEKQRKDAITQQKRDEKDLANLQKDKINATNEYVKIIEAGAAAIAAIVGYNGIKGGVTKAYGQLFDFEQLAEATGLSVKELRIWESALGKAGVSYEEFTNIVLEAKRRANEATQPIVPLDTLFGNYRKNIIGLPPQARSQFTKEQTGSGAITVQNAFSSPDFEKRRLAAESDISNTPDTKNASQFLAQTATLATKINDVFTNLLENVLPPLTHTLEALNDWLNNKTNSTGAQATAGGFAAFFTVASLTSIWQKISSIGKKAVPEITGESILGLFLKRIAIPIAGSIFAYQEVRANKEGRSDTLFGKFSQWISDKIEKRIYGDKAIGSPNDVTAQTSAHKKYSLQTEEGKREAISDIFNADIDAMKLVKDSQIAATIGPQIPQGYGKTISVKIDDVTVNTQATDAGGISRDIVASLRNSFDDLINNWDDGVAK